MYCAMYHVMSRGNRRADIYLDDVDRQDFLKNLAEACLKTGWQVHERVKPLFFAFLIDKAGLRLAESDHATPSTA